MLEDTELLLTHCLSLQESEYSYSWFGVHAYKQMRLRVSDTRHLVVRRATFFTNIKVLLKRKSRIIFAACAVWIVGFLFYQIGKTDGGYSEWSNYSDCSVSCGKGTRRKFRTCTNPAPNFIGRSCSGIGPKLRNNTVLCKELSRWWRVHLVVGVRRLHSILWRWRDT